MVRPGTRSSLLAPSLALACWVAAGAATWVGSWLLQRSGDASWRNLQLLSMSSTLLLGFLYAQVFRRFVATPSIVGGGGMLLRGASAGAVLALGTTLGSLLVCSLLTGELVHIAIAKVAWQPLQTLFVFSAALNEELFFRGFVLAILAAWCRPLWAVVIQAALFTAMHLVEQRPGAVELVLLFVGGVLLGALAQHFRSLVPSTICHALINLASCSYVESSLAQITGGRGVASGLSIDVMTGDYATVSLAHTALIALCLAVFVWRRRQARRGASVVLHCDAPSMSRMP